MTSRKTTTPPLVRHLLDDRDGILKDWVRRARQETLIQAALPGADLRALAEECFEGLLARLADGEEANGFAGFTSVTSMSPAEPDLLIALHAFMFAGKSAIFSVQAQREKQPAVLTRTAASLDRAFCSYLLKVTAHFNADASVQTTPSRLNLFYNAFKHSTDAILLTNRAGEIIDVNQAFLRIFRYAREEVLGKSTALLRSSQTTDGLYREMWEAINTKGSWTGEIYNKAKDGEEIPILLSITPILENDEIVGYMGIEIDRREQIRLERRLLQQERLALIGKMASKVAHEIRNPLSAISLNSELLEDEFARVRETDMSEAKGLLQSVMAEVDRLTQLTEDYLQFSRLPATERSEGNLVTLLVDVLDFIEAEANSMGIQVLRDVPESLPAIRFDSHQIRRVLLNLLRNALEAMPTGGLLRCSARHDEEDVEIRISDSGKGIQPSDQEHVFEPFYTTREMGTGLGLPLSLQIVQEHGGRLWFESDLEKGTVFMIRLPGKSGKQTGDTE